MNSKLANMSIFQLQRFYQTTFSRNLLANVLLRVLSSHHVGEQLGQDHQTFRNISIIIRFQFYSLVNNKCSITYLQGILFPIIPKLIYFHIKEKSFHSKESQ